MRRGNGAGTTRRAWLAGRIAALLAIVVLGTLAIFHYSDLGQALASKPAGPGVTAKATIAATRIQAGAPGASGTPASKSGTTSKASAGQGSAGGDGVGQQAGHGAGTAAPAAGTAAAATTAPAHFRTLPPSAVLPTSAQCTQWVRQHPSAENKAANKTANHVTGQHVGPHFFAGGDSPLAQRRLAPRINGDFTGTTKDILRWTACKWGIDQSVVFAQAAVESWWQQGTLGDWDSDAAACPKGHKLGADGRPGQCPQSYGILQNRWPYEKGSWPGIGRSTAMNADTAYAIWRSCYDGYEPWLNTVEHNGTYHKGDLWGCVGRWFAGRWHTAPAQQYIAKVKQYERQRIWLTKDFQQGGG